jgi:hypothetical protein
LIKFVEMNRIINDNQIVFQLLEECDALFDNYNADRVLEVEHGDSLYIVLYTSANRNFVAFEGLEFKQKVDSLPALLQLVQEYKGNVTSEMLHDAVKIIEYRIHSGNNSNFYFDAH